MAHIFISYSKEDIEFVRYLRALLEKEGFGLWVDEARLQPSARWWKDIERNIDRCSAFIVVMSPNASESDWVEREILRAESQRKPIYPVLLAGAPWSRLANIQFEDLRAGLHARLSSHFVEALRTIIRPAAPGARRWLQITLEEGDITTFAADVVALKYAQNFYGADLVVANLLGNSNSDLLSQRFPEPGNILLAESQGAVTAPQVLFVGTPSLRHMGYEQVRRFAARALSGLADAAPQTRHIAMTIHGPGFGLDEVESLRSQLDGFMEAMRAGQCPPALERITIVERSPRRVTRLVAALHDWFAAHESESLDSGQGYRLAFPTPGEPSSTETTQEAPARLHAFVVMPNSVELEDVFYFGIQGPAHARALLCERIEASEYDADLFNQARARIDTAAVVVVVLTHADPLIYLQLGYAWGARRNVVMLRKNGTPMLLDAQPMCYVYHSIKDAEATLSAALDELKAQGRL